jgi:hypothetical protein
MIRDGAGGKLLTGDAGRRNTLFVTGHPETRALAEVETARDTKDGPK